MEVTMNGYEEVEGGQIEEGKYSFAVTVARSSGRVWRALVDEIESASWYYGTSIRSSWEVGTRYEYVFPDGTVAIEGIVEEVNAGHRLIMSFSARWDVDVASDESSRITWVIAPLDSVSCRVMVTHENVVAGSATERQIARGWPELLSGLKAYVER
jgi:uncharacterized protein YndB with AHSA1/START domain